MRAPALCLLFLCLTHTASAAYVPAPGTTPPLPPRETRGAWIATVHNLDWPSHPGLSAARQQQELTALMDLAARLHLNTLILQVRSACDAIYPSTLEPWSHFLTGHQGQTPGYDPLAFAITEAHRRGIELHAWINPFRAQAGTPPSFAPNHLLRLQPDWIKPAGTQKWLNPARDDTQAHTLAVARDLVRRYDIDALHIDDYFYPYPPKGTNKQNFPDYAEYKAYQDAGGKLTRSDWRRERINTFVRRLHLAIKEQKPAVRFGISPFGIWRPTAVPGVKGDLDPYETLAADSRLWLQRGWCDYFSPQLYWPCEGPQSFPLLLNWWKSQNTLGRHLWPGLAPERINSSRPASDFTRQILLTRQTLADPGQLHWNLTALKQNRGGFSDALRNNYYSRPALPPASPWIKSPPPPPLNPTVTGNDLSGVRIQWLPQYPPTRWVLLQTCQGNATWNDTLLPASAGSTTLASQPRIISLRAVSQNGSLGPPSCFKKNPP